MPLLVTQGLGAGGGGAAFIAESLTVSPYQIIINFPEDNEIQLIGRGLEIDEYTIVPTGDGVKVKVLSVEASGHTIILTTSDMTNGENYTLNIPDLGIIDANDAPCAGPFELAFTGAATSPEVSMITTIDCRLIEVLFNKPMNKKEATNINNYSIDGSLEVNAAVLNQGNSYFITTSRQVIGQSYTLTVTNIHDTGGNVI